LIFSLVLLTAISFVWVQRWFQPGTFASIIPPQPVEPVAIIQTETSNPTASSTPTSQPTLTDTHTPNPSQLEPIPILSTTTILSPSPTPTYTVSATRASTSTPTQDPTPISGQVPERLLFKLYYNENSLYFHNLSRVTRSISGFTFERLNDQGEVLNFFGGWDWGFYYPNTTPNRCMAIEIYLSQPFVRPSECRRPYLSILNPQRDDSRIFWTTLENSPEFRVLWQQEEIGRCQTGTGVCEVYLLYYLP